MRLWSVLICAGLACQAQAQAQAQAQDAMRLGIFGVAEGIGPLVVAGREVVLSEEVPVISPLGPGEAVAMGDTLAIVASLRAGRLEATRVLKVFPVAGPVAGVAEGAAIVMGTVVHIPPDVSVKNGQWVALSGFWNGETVITTGLRHIARDGFALLTGAIEPPAGSDPRQLGGSKIIGAQMPKDGFGSEIWSLGGKPEGEGLRVRLMSRGLFGGQVDMALWQGYASLPVASQTYMIHGTGILGTATDALMPAAGSLVTRCVIEGRVVNAAPEKLAAAFEVLDCARYIAAD